MQKEYSRRSIITRALAASGAALISGKAMANVCALTPEQTEGPFYPVSDQADKNNDLTVVKGRPRQALGRIAILSGVVQDEFCRPIKGGDG